MTDEELLRWYQCGRKERLETFEDAEQLAERIEATQPVHHEVTAYECVHCSGFHVGRTRNGMRPGKQQIWRARRKWASRATVLDATLVQ